MSALSNYAEDTILEHIVGKNPMPMPTVSVALYTTAPTDADAGVEVSGGGYARIPTTGTDWRDALNGVVSNDVPFEWQPATASWGSVVAVALVDEADNILVYGTTNQAKTIEAGDTYRISPQNLRLELD